MKYLQSTHNFRSFLICNVKKRMQRRRRRLGQFTCIFPFSLSTFKMTSALWEFVKSKWLCFIDFELRFAYISIALHLLVSRDNLLIFTQHVWLSRKNFNINVNCLFPIPYSFNGGKIVSISALGGKEETNIQIDPFHFTYKLFR